jgi:hypothetical protein
MVGARGGTALSVARRMVVQDPPGRRVVGSGVVVDADVRLAACGPGR